MRADRTLPSTLYNPDLEPPANFVDFFWASVLPLLDIKGRGCKRRRKMACVMVFSLVKAKGVNRAVARHRHLSEITRMERNLWDAIVAAGLAKMDKGGQWDEGTITRYRATPKLIEMKAHWSRELAWPEREANDFQFTRLHDGKKNGKNNIDLRHHLESITSREGFPILLRYFTETDTAIRAINEMNCRHEFVVPFIGANATIAPDIRLTQVHSGALWSCARICTTGRDGAQGMPKKQRQQLTIDGERCVELDFVSCHPRLLYQLFSIPAEGDLYRPERFFDAYDEIPEKTQKQLRGIAKATFTRANNNATPGKSFGSLYKYAQNKKARNTKDGLPCNLRPYVADSNRTDVLARALMERLERAHPELAKRNLLHQNWGFRIMFLESTIMSLILRRFTEADIPVLPIHDGLCVRASDRRFARRTMLKSWKLVVVGKGKVKVK